MAETDKKFTFMVEDCYQIEPGVIQISGNVHGTAVCGSDVYILYPGRVKLPAKITAIETGASAQAEEVKDEAAALTLQGIASASLILRYAVTTNLDEKDNPYLSGLSEEFVSFREEQEYVNLLFYAVCHASYVVPVVYNETNKAGGVLRSKRNDRRFTSLHHPQTKDPVFPVFTDQRSFFRWTGFLAKHEPVSERMTFPEVLQALKGGCKGIVINAFGPQDILFTESMIASLTASPAYQQEFLKKDRNMPQHNLTPDQKLMIGYPVVTEEVKAIQAGLCAYASFHEDIRCLYLLLKQDEAGELAYLCIVDCDKQKEQELFRGLYQEVGMYLRNITNMDFVNYADASFASETMAVKAPLYQL